MKYIKLMKMPDPFQQLPAPILLQIFKELTDVPSICQFVQASSSASSLFGELPLEILATAIARYPQDLQRLVAAVAGGLTQEGMAVQRHTLERDGPERDRLRLSPLLSPTPHTDLLSANLPLSAVYKLMTMTCYIYQLTASCLREHITRFHSYVPLPEVSEHGHPGFPPQLFQTASWIEEYRVFRTLWRLWLALRIRIAMKNTGTSKGRIDSHVFSALYTCESDEMECLRDWMQGEGLSLDEIDSSLTRFPRSRSSSWVTLNTATRASLLVDPPSDQNSRAWHQDIFASTRQSPGYDFFMHYIGCRKPDLDWRVFRRMGCGIWDIKRLCAMDMLTVERGADPQQLLLRTGVGKKMSRLELLSRWKHIQDCAEYWLSKKY